MDNFSKVFWAISLTALIAFLVLPPVWWWKPLFIFLYWIIVVHILSRFFVTSFGYRKKPLPRKVSKLLQKDIDSIKGSTEQRLEKAYSLIIRKFHGESGKTYVRLGELFWSDVNAEWKKGGYANCTKINYFFRLLLVKSKTFSDDQIRIIAVSYRYNTHQYVKITTPEGVMVFDPTFDYAGIPFARKNDGWWKKHFDPNKYAGLYRK